jgi:hypothetical protein
MRMTTLKARVLLAVFLVMWAWDFAHAQLSGTLNFGGVTYSVSGELTATPVPAAAAAVGYNTRTFGPAVTLGANWFPWSFYGSVPPAGGAVQNADGSLSITGLAGNTYGGNVASAQHIATGNKWSGNAFGGGAYFEAVLSFTNQGTGPYNNGGPAFWALDIEHTSQGPYVVNWPGQPATYNDFFEVDFMEYDTGKANGLQNGIGNWYGASGTGTHNPYVALGFSSDCYGCVLVPASTNFAIPHKYGALWMPATASTQGYLKFYFDDVEVGPPFVWNKCPTVMPPPPVNGSTAMCGMDQRHMMLILGTGTDQPMTVQSVSVWQISAANNLSN